MLLYVETYKLEAVDMQIQRVRDINALALMKLFERLWPNTRQSAGAPKISEYDIARAAFCFPTTRL